MANLKNVNRALAAQGLKAVTGAAVGDVYAQQLIDQAQASEQAYSNIYGLLGQPGTYGNLSTLLPQVGGINQTGGVNLGISDSTVGATTYPQLIPGVVGAVPQWGGPSNLMKTTPPPDWIKNQISWVGEQYKGGASDAAVAAARANLPNITTVDPNKLTTAISGTPQFQMASLLTAQAGQLAAHTGPLYDQFVQEITKSTMEQAQATGKQAEATFRTAEAQQGWARPTQANTMFKAQLDMQTNMQASQQLDQAMLQLNTWVGPYAQSVLAFNQEWAAGLPFIRSAYQQAMTNATEMMVTGALPFNLQALSLQTQYGILDQRSKVKKNWTGTLIGVGLAVVGGALTMGAASGALTAGWGIAGAVLSGASGIGGLFGSTPTQGANANVIGGITDATQRYVERHPFAAAPPPTIKSAPSYEPWQRAYLDNLGIQQSSQFGTFVDQAAGGKI